MNMKTAIYTRVSSSQQVEGFSLEAQYEKLLQYADLNSLELFDTYTDPGVSAKDLNRPGIQQLLSDMKAGKFEAIIVHKLDRLTRNISDLYDLVELVNKHNVKLISLSENIDTSTPMGRFFVFMLGIFAQMFRENLAEEVVKGQSQRARKGLRNTSAKPYGYDVGDNLALTINEEEAEVVRRIYAWYIGGYGRNKIATLLNEEGIPAARGGMWQEKIIVDIIRNVTNIGAVHWKRKGDPEEKRIIVYDCHEPIVSLETFETAQEVFQRRFEEDMSTSSYDFPFSSIVKCGECGRSYHGKQITKARYGNKTRNYRCSGKYRQISCDASDISELKLIDLFFRFIHHLTAESTEPERVIEGKDIVKEKKRLDKLLLDSANRRKNYTRAMGDGKLPYEQFVELIDEENSKSKTWQEELDALLQTAPTSRKARKDVLRLINDLPTRWPHLTHMERKASVQHLFKFLVIKKQGKEWNIVGYKLNE